MSGYYGGSTGFRAMCRAEAPLEGVFVVVPEQPLPKGGWFERLWRWAFRKPRVWMA